MLAILTFSLPFSPISFSLILSTDVAFAMVNNAIPNFSTQLNFHSLPYVAS